MKIYKFFIPDIQAKERPRFVGLKTIRSKKTGLFKKVPIVTTPTNTKLFEAEIGWLAKQHFSSPLKGPVRVDINIYHPNPLAKNSGDRDNILKAVQDGLNKIAYEDDSQVVAGSPEKIQSSTKYGIEIIIQPHILKIID